jgi:hypothetical protein
MPARACVPTCLRACVSLLQVAMIRSMARQDLVPDTVLAALPGGDSLADADAHADADADADADASGLDLGSLASPSQVSNSNIPVDEEDAGMDAAAMAASGPPMQAPPAPPAGATVQSPATAAAGASSPAVVAPAAAVVGLKASPATGGSDDDDQGQGAFGVGDEDD